MGRLKAKTCPHCSTTKPLGAFYKRGRGGTQSYCKACRSLDEKRRRRVGVREVWRGMLQRCRQPSDKAYAAYGGRGIKVCARWGTYRLFIADMGDRPEGTHASGYPKYTLDRINNDGDYEPSNCRWATSTEQNRNRRGRRFLTLGVETMPVYAWAERLGVEPQLIYRRLHHGWTDAQVLTVPKGCRR